MEGGGKRKIGKAKSKNLVGSRVRIARLEFPGRLTQDQLSGRLAALKVSIDRVAVTKIELGTRHVYDYEIGPLAEALKVDVRWLLGLEKP